MPSGAALACLNGRLLARVLHCIVVVVDRIKWTVTISKSNVTSIKFLVKTCSTRNSTGNLLDWLQCRRQLPRNLCSKHGRELSYSRKKVNSEMHPRSFNQFNRRQRQRRRPQRRPRHRRRRRPRRQRRHRRRHRD